MLGSLHQQFELQIVLAFPLPRKLTELRKAASQAAPAGNCWPSWVHPGGWHVAKICPGMQSGIPAHSSNTGKAPRCHVQGLRSASALVLPELALWHGCVQPDILWVAIVIQDSVNLKLIVLAAQRCLIMLHPIFMP